MDLAENYIPEKVLQGRRRIVVKAQVGRMKELQVLVGYKQAQKVLELEHSLELQAVEEHMKELQELVRVPLLRVQGVVCRFLLPEHLHLQDTTS